MKKTYQKPEIVFMHLRPEERLAACQWPIGFWSGASCTQAWSAVPQVSATCISMYNNAPTAGS